MKKLKDVLFGAKLIKLDKTGLVFVKDKSTYTLEIVEDEGDCCGYNEISTKLFFDNIDNTNNPCITKIERVVEDHGEESFAKITLFGLDKKLAEIESTSSSGSGWCYGACVTLKCKELDYEEVLTEW